MKKKIIIPIIVCLILIIGVVGFVIWNNRIVSTITLDINPSIEINLDRNEKVKSVVALNNDAKEIVSDDLEGKFIDDTLEIITNNLIDKGYIDENQIEIILYSNGNIKSDEVESKIKNSFEKKHISVDIITIENINKDDKELAKKHNISLAKAAYINSIAKENDNISFEDLANKSVNELKETKETGNYCDKGYTLDNNLCFKEKEKVDALKGSVCPNGYVEYNRNCYKETKAIENDKFLCREGFKLVNKDCVNTQTHKAEVKCNKGELRGDKCLERKIIGEAYEFCRDSGRTLYNHKCLATKPSINGGCLNGDMLLNGKCVNTRNDYYMAEWKCPDGKVKSNADGTLLDNDTHCYEEILTSDISYSCGDEGYTLIGDECTTTYIEAARRELICQDGYIKIDGDRCINKTDIKEKVEGYYCKGENNRLVGNKCIIYEVVEPKHN